MPHQPERHKPLGIRPFLLLACVVLLGQFAIADPVVIDFEDLTNNQQIGDRYPGVLFGVDWIGFDPNSNNPIYNPFGNMGVTFGFKELNSIFFIGQGPTSLTLFYTFDGPDASGGDLEMRAYDELGNLLDNVHGIPNLGTLVMDPFTVTSPNPIAFLTVGYFSLAPGHNANTKVFDDLTYSGLMPLFGDDHLPPPPTSVPEPATLSLLAAGLLAGGLFRKRFKGEL